jgi:CDP-glycerol glycerophosphotransferase (TagB/SpsB family)
VHNYLFVQYKEQMWDQRLQGMPACHHNVRIVAEPDTQRVYALADVMITDTGTTAALEFSLLKRPLLVYRNIDWFQNKAHYEVEEAICQTALLFDALPEMTDLLKSIFAGSAEGILNTQRKAQEMLVNRYLYHPGTAAPTAVEAIQKELH